ncbi:MAG: 4-alpha-glucanotransferase [Candidatus Anammoximicrobium sp.]|nr:4-alpha-glucanotransferase [Candidatus Anammoximicrobium sp.]
MSSTPASQQAIRAALARLGIERLVLSIHQASFPPAHDDIGHGTPYSDQGWALIAWLAGLGFTGVALGPAGITSRTNPSPYDATALSRNPCHIALRPLCERGLLDTRRLAAAVENRPSGAGAAYAYAWTTQRRLLESVAALARNDAAVAAGVTQLQQTAPWLAAEAGYEAQAAAAGHDDWRRWPPEPPPHHDAAWSFLVSQWLVREQHAAFRSHARRLGLRVYGDLAIGTSHREQFLFRDLFLAGYAMGAPPSRTNPDGQPWGYPLLNPEKLGPDGEAWRYAAMRLDAILQDHDGLRIDHPHGWVCPWVYRTDDPDPLHAVQNGARLYESPDLPDHPALAAYARVHSDQIDRSQPRHADNWVHALEPGQLAQYARPFDLIVRRVQAHGGGTPDLMVEVLSTCPRPLAEALARHGLGRFRVIQKANVRDPQDPYRSDQAPPQDWIMLGNHDTPPLRAVLETWQGTDEWNRRAAYLAARLATGPQERVALQTRLAEDQTALLTAMFADLFCGPARNVLIFWADLFGLRKVYNRPGVADPANWSLRAPADFDAAYRDARDRGEAPDLGLALAWALRARRLDQDAEGQELSKSLQKCPTGRAPTP